MILATKPSDMIATTFNVAEERVVFWTVYRQMPLEVLLSHESLTTSRTNFASLAMPADVVSAPSQFNTFQQNTHQTHLNPDLLEKVRVHPGCSHDKVVVEPSSDAGSLGLPCSWGGFGGAKRSMFTCPKLLKGPSPQRGEYKCCGIA